MLRRNPAAAAARIAALASNHVDIVIEDDNAGTLTLRDRRTGKTVTMCHLDQAKGGKFSFSAEGDDGKTATMEFGGAGGKIPSWVPSYPGSSPQFNITARGEDGNGTGEGGNFTFFHLGLRRPRALFLPGQGEGDGYESQSHHHHRRCLQW